MNKCERCGESQQKPLSKIAVKKGKQTVIINVCLKCFNKAV
jgi:hypothetical protein